MLNKYRYYSWKMNYPSNFIEYILSPAPWGLRILNFIVQKIFRLNKKSKFMVHFSSTVSGNIIIGRDVARYFANCGGCYIQGINGIEIGDNTIFAPGVKMISANHDKNDLSKHDEKTGPIRIGNDCWIATNAVILPGVQLGNNVVVAAGAVVTKSFPSNVVIAGVPAKIISNDK